MSAIATRMGATAQAVTYPHPGTERHAGTGSGAGYDAERHLAAVARTLQWADESAERGDPLDAIAWLKTLEAIGDKLPEVYEIRRDSWRAQLRRTRTVDNTRRGNRAA
jgi:hypothetical protein